MSRTSTNEYKDGLLFNSRANEANALRGAERRAIAHGESSTAILFAQDAFLAENNVTSWFEFIMKDTVNT